MTETRALLLTDVVDSTRLSEELGDVAMAALWARHDRVARDLLVTHGGREIDKTDGFLMLFEAADGAVAYAVAYHRALAELGIAARAGLHVGEVILTANSPADVARGAKPLEVDGIAKPTAARVMSIATGGQTLLTPSAVEALGGSTLRLQSHGHWRMKGVSEPIELFEVGDEDAPFLPPPDGAKVYRVVSQGGLWLPAREVKHSLPAERDAFVGREADLRELAQRLGGERRLVSVLGIGGTGKTRLVVRFGWTWLGDHPGGVWFCDLSEARSVEDIARAVARGLDVPLGREEPVEQLGNAIAGRGPCLVLLDNFEQVARHAEDTLGQWLDRAPEARFVVTTREVLGITGEQTLALAPLPTTQGASLFVARARAAKRGFEPDDPASIDNLVELLDGLPLAIELAAARVRMMSPDKLLARMSQRFKLLAAGGRRQDRQATLRATLDWSWDLLDEDERAALAQLSVFEGGFNLDAAEAVLELDEAWPMDAVQALVDKSLVRQVSDERFGLLVSVQEYATEKLGDDRAEAERRHGEHFAGYGTREAIRLLDLHGGVALRRALSQELDNLVAASRRAGPRGADEVAILSALAAWQVFKIRGPMGAGVAVLESVQDLDAPALLRARATAALCESLRFVGRILETRERFGALLVEARALGDSELEVQARSGLGILAQSLGRVDEARAAYEQALELLVRDGDRKNEGILLGNLAIFYGDLGQLELSVQTQEAALAAHREVGNRQFEGVALVNLANLHFRLGNGAEARTLYLEALAAARDAGSRRLEGAVLSNLINVLESDELDDYVQQALVMTREVGDRRFEGILRGNLAELHMGRGELGQARAHYDAALTLARETRDRRSEAIALGNLGTLHRRTGDEVAARTCLQEALAMAREIKDPHFEAWVVEQLAELDGEE